MARKLTTGFWCAENPNGFESEFVWRYLNLVNGEAFERVFVGDVVEWRCIARTAADVRELAAQMRVSNWGLCDPAESEDMRADLGAYPDGMVAGGLLLCESDVLWRTNGVAAGFDCLAKAPTAYVLVAEPEPVTVEFAEVDCEPLPAAEAVVAEVAPEADAKQAETAVVPIGKSWRDMPELAALGVKPKVFGRLHHRVAYVFAAAGRVVVAWKDGYAKGSDLETEGKLGAYVKSLGLAA
jgi:hypothetical protein